MSEALWQLTGEDRLKMGRRDWEHYLFMEAGSEVWQVWLHTPSMPELLCHNSDWDCARNMIQGSFGFLETFQIKFKDSSMFIIK